ncbi:MAG: hypothetical protein ABL308_01400 [Oceanicaulis sp.]
MICNLMKTTLLACAAGAAAACAAPAAPHAHASAYGEWRLAAPRCPDLVEDRIDRRIVWSRADLREDRRDARVVECPANALVWVPSPNARRALAPIHPGAVLVRHLPDGRYAVADRRGRPVDVRIVVDL